MPSGNGKKGKAKKKLKYNVHKVSSSVPVDNTSMVNYDKSLQDYDKSMDKVNMKNKQAKAIQKKLNNKINLGEESMYTGNAYFDIGSGISRRHANNKPSRLKKQAARIKNRAERRVQSGGTRAGNAIRKVKGAFKKR